MHQVVLAVYYLFGQNAIPTRHFSQKKLWMEIQNRLFPTNTRPHPLNLSTACPPILYWLGTSGWCSGSCVLVPLSFTFVFFYAYVVSAMSRSAMCLFYSCLSSTKRCIGFWVFLISSHSLMGLFACLA